MRGEAPGSRNVGLAGAGVSLALLALGTWLIAPRFDIAAPSLIDDWGVIERSHLALDAVWRGEWLTGTPEGADAINRFRPAFAAVWNPLQWHTLGAPDEMTGPNLWNELRLALLVAGLVAVTIAAIPGRLGLRWPVLALLAAGPPALILTTPSTPIDLARLGLSEPLMVAAMLTGGLLIVLASKRLIAGAEGGFARFRSMLPLIGGYPLWLLGVYFKEPSACFLVLAPFLYLELNRRWREEGVLRRPLIRERTFQLVSASLLLPVLHVAAVSGSIALGGTTTYGHQVPTGLGGLKEAFTEQWTPMNTILGTPLWKGVALAVPFLVLGGALEQRRVPWLSIGMVLTGWAILVFQGAGGEVASRYYIPVIALFAVAGALALAESPAWIRALGIVAVALAAAGNAPSARDHTEAWARGESLGVRTVDEVAKLDIEHCAVQQSGIDVERRLAIPSLVELKGSRQRGCDRRFAALLVHPLDAGPPSSEPIDRACASDWRAVRPAGFLIVYGCRRLRAGRIEVPGAGTQTIRSVLAASRLAKQ